MPSKPPLHTSVLCDDALVYNFPFAFLKLCREPHRLIHHAAAKGVPEARDVLNEVCAKGHCV